MSEDPFSLESEIRKRVTDRDLFGVEKVLGLSRHRFLKLLDEPSDWSLVIKLAVILEASLTQVLASRLATPELQKHLARLPVDGRTGKLQLAEDLDVLDRVTVRRVRTIFSLRNLFAHDVAAIEQSLASVVSSMSVAERNDFANTMLRIDESQKIDNSGREKTEIDLRLIIWLGAGLSLSQLTQVFHRNEASRRWIAARVLVGDAFFAQRAGDSPTYRNKLKQAISTLEGEEDAPTTSKASPTPRSS